MKKTGFLLSVALAVVCANGETLDSLKTRAKALEFTGSNGKVLKYRLVEKTPSDGSKVPLLFFFHGAGQRGDDNTAQLGNLPDIVTWLDSNEQGFKIVAGQVPSGKLWVDVKWDSLAHTMSPEPSESMGLALELLDAFLEDSAVDTNRVYATGLSMGGYGTWDIISRRPEVFAAAVPICGGADVAQATKLTAMPIWAFHGSKDGSVPVFRSRSMMSALWNAGADAHYWEYPDAPHDVWSRTYRNNDVLKWFFSQEKTTATGGGGDVPVIGPVENDLGDVRLESEAFTLQALATGPLTDHAETFTIVPGAGKGGLDRIVVKGGAGYANAHLDIHEFFREGNALLDIHAAENLLGTAALGTAGSANITCSYGVSAAGSGSEGTKSAPVVPWARGALSSDDKDAAWTQLVTFGDNGFRFLDPETEYETFASAQTGVVPTSGANVRVTAAGVVDFAGSPSVNSLSMLSTPSAATTVYVTNGTMRIASGVLDLSSNKDNTTVNGNIDFGEATGYITYYHAKKAALAGSISGKDVVIADTAIDESAAKGLLTVSAGGTFTGDLYVNGSATITGASFIPSGARTGNVMVNGKLFVDAPSINGLYGSGTIDKPYTGTKTFTLGDNDADGDFSGTIMNTKGNYAFLKKGSGTQKFGGSVTIGGQFNVSAGTVELTGTLSCGPISIAPGAAFVIDFPERVTAEARLFVKSTSSLAGVAFTKGDNVEYVELREDGTELWAKPRDPGFVIAIASK